jgi:DNA adenine methylase
MKPFVKWQGGKAQLLQKLRSLFPTTFKDYYEPFIGGGAVLFDMAHPTPRINDFNQHLVEVYRIFAGNDADFALFKANLKDVETRFNSLATLASKEIMYMQYRNMDKNQAAFSQMTPVERAVRFVFLNKTGFNGRYRENSRGEFNIPYGGFKKVKLVNPDFDDIHNYFVRSAIQITQGDFAVGTAPVSSGDFVYMDPPYDPIVPSELNYTKEGFSRADQLRVRDEMNRLTGLGALCAVSNHNTKFVRAIYDGYRVEVVLAKRSINVKGDGRGAVEEVVIMNYDTDGNIIHANPTATSEPEEAKEKGEGK